MVKNLKIGAKLTISFVFIAFVSTFVISLIAYYKGKESLEAESFNKLTAVREIKSVQIEDYFQQISNQIITFSEDHTIIEATQRFKQGFHNINNELGVSEDELGQVDERIQAYYNQEFLANLNPNLDRPTQFSDYRPAGINTRILQDIYISSNTHDTGSKQLLLDAGNNSSYNQVHMEFHGIIRSYLEKFGYYDIFIIDAETGHIIYTVFKEVDFGTSLLTGPYKETNLAEAFRAAVKSDDKDFTRLVDFKPYHPSYNTHASFIACPIFHEDKIIGVLVFQMPIERINDIMTSRHEWGKVGLGKSGETYIVGEDYTLRNQSRFLFEDRDNYFKMITDIGVPANVINKIQNFNSSIGLQEIKTSGTDAALAGISSTQVFPDYRGVSVLSSYKPLKIKDMNWVIMSEIDEEEAFSSVVSLRNLIYVSFLGLIAIIIIAAVSLSKTITTPLRLLTKYSKELAAHDFSSSETFLFSGSLDDIALKGDETGTLARTFKQMQSDLENSIQNLKNTTSIKERMEGELSVGREIQMNMLPLIFPAFPDHDEFNVYAVLEPAREVGGDFYDFFFIDENKFCFCIGDVSGKGVPSALFMAVSKTLIKSRAMDDLSTASIVTHVNNELSSDNKAYMFVTLFIGILDLKTGKFTFTNAGHNPPYIQRKDNTLERINNRHGPVVGAVADLAYKEDTQHLYPGDILLMYTDGVTEAKNPSNMLFSDRRLADFLSGQNNPNVGSMVKDLLEETKSFQGSAEQADDITILGLEYSRSPDADNRPRLEMRITNDLKQIGKVTADFQKFAAENNLPDDIRRKFSIVFDELLNNIISYAYNDDKEHEIEITTRKEKDKVIIRISDDGIPFNPFGITIPDTSAPLEQREIGGLGIHLIRKFMDKADYERKINRNIVTLAKNIIETNQS
jgi:serine phosphatase RsbU (regulator of sigma subunit)/anti-sigma regulatory factor (Ser/Thr protein kinase)